MTNGFEFNHDKSLKIYFFCVKRQAKNDFLKDVESTVVGFLSSCILQNKKKKLRTPTVGKLCSLGYWFNQAAV